MYALHCLLGLLACHSQQLEYHRIGIPVEFDRSFPPRHYSFLLILPLALGVTDDLDEVSAGEVHLGVKLLLAVEVL